VTNFNAVVNSSEALSISSVIKNHFNPENQLMKNVPWEDNIFCTKNFILTVLTSEADQYIQEVLRPVDTFIYFEDSKCILLISEREADRILSMMWALRSKEGTSVSYFSFHDRRVMTMH
jgi:hypothetical protein